MSRLYDRIMRDEKLGQTFNRWLDYPVILADNVAHYIHENGRIISYKDVPNVAPPFTRFVIEFRSTRDLYVKSRIAYFFEAFHLPDINKYPDIEWGIEVHQIVEWAKGSKINTNYEARFSYAIDKFGLMIDPDGLFPDGELPCSAFLKPNGFFALAKTVGIPGAEIHQVLAEMYIPLMAIGLMHCKNVELIDEVPPPKLSRKAEQRYGVPMVKYKVLKVNSMRREYADDDRDSQPGIPKSLHICRGHFKDYRNGGGLFGKYEGIYWWDQHVRGDAKRGVVVKDYDVQAPSEN